MALRYWRGGTGTWSPTLTTNWSTTSGGAGGASVPTTSDDVIFDAASGTGTVTITNFANCLSLNMTGSGLFTFTSTGTVNCVGNFTIVSNTTWNATGTITFTGTGTTLTSGRTLACAVTINCPGLTRTIGTNGLRTTNLAGVVLTAGNLSLVSNITCAGFTSNNSNVRSIAFGTASIDLSGNNPFWNTSNATNLTRTGTPNVFFSGTVSLSTITANATGGSSTNAFDFRVFSGTSLSITSLSSIRSLNFTGFVGSYTGTWSPGSASCTFYGDVTLVSGMTFTAGTGIWTFALGLQQTLTSAGKTVGPITLSTAGTTLRLGDTFSQTTTTAITTIGASTTINLNAQTNSFNIVSASFASTFWTGGTIVVRGITQTGGTVAFPVANLTYTNGPYIFTAGTLDLTTASLTCTTFDSSNSNVRSIIFGTNNITCTGSGIIYNTNIISNLTYTGTPTINISNNTATATTIASNASAGGSNAFNFNITTGTYALTISTGSSVRDLNFTGFTGTWSPGSAACVFYGSLTLVSGMTFTAGIGVWSFASTSATQVLTSAGKTLGPITQITTGSGKVQLAAGTTTLNTLRTYTFTAGTLDLATNNATLSCGLFSSTNSNARAIQFGTGNITTTGSGTVWNSSTSNNLTYTGTPTVNISNPTATATTITTGVTGGAVTNAFNFNFTTGTYALTITSASTVRSLNFTGFTGTWSPVSATCRFFGDLTLDSGMTFTSGSSAWTFAATSGTQSITSAGKILNSITQSGVGGTVAFVDATTLDANTYTFSAGTLQLPASTTTTIGSFVTTGTTLKYLTSSIPGTQATLSSANNATVTYLSIQDNNATGGGIFNNNDASNVLVSNVTGWTNSSAPTTTNSGNFFMLF